MSREILRPSHPFVQVDFAGEGDTVVQMRVTRALLAPAISLALLAGVLQAAPAAAATTPAAVPAELVAVAQALREPSEGGTSFTPDTFTPAEK